MNIDIKKEQDQKIAKKDQANRGMIKKEEQYLESKIGRK